MTRQNALFKEILNFFINLNSVQINLRKGMQHQKNVKGHVAGIDESHHSNKLMVLIESLLQ